MEIHAEDKYENLSKIPDLKPVKTGVLWSLPGSRKTKIVLFPLIIMLLVFGVILKSLLLLGLVTLLWFIFWIYLVITDKYLADEEVVANLIAMKSIKENKRKMTTLTIGFGLFILIMAILLIPTLW